MLGSDDEEVLVGQTELRRLVELGGQFLNGRIGEGNVRRRRFRPWDQDCALRGMVELVATVRVSVASASEKESCAKGATTPVSAAFCAVLGTPAMAGALFRLLIVTVKVC